MSTLFEQLDVSAISLSVILLLIGVIGGLVGYMIRRQDARHDRLERSLDAMTTELAETKERATRQDGRIELTNERAKALALSIDKMDVQFGKIGEQFGAMSEQLVIMRERYKTMSESIQDMRSEVAEIRSSVKFED